VDLDVGEVSGEHEAVAGRGDGRMLRTESRQVDPLRGRFGFDGHSPEIDE
jgi:hypothetical protein